MKLDNVLKAPKEAMVPLYGGDVLSERQKEIPQT